MPLNFDVDARVRAAAFAFLEHLRQIHGEVFPRDVLLRGFDFDGQRVPLLSPQQGIFKPRVLDAPISILTSPPTPGKPAPYADQHGVDGLLTYMYRGTDPNHRDNAGLRAAMQYQLPLVYFFGVLPGRYLAAWPAYIVGDHPELLQFTVALDDKVKFNPQTITAVAEPIEEVRRAYVTAAVKRRLHQASFRERVIDAYKTHCAICRLRHRELLEAAHILPDGHPKGEPIVPNGLALCKLHHAAFDAHILGVRPDCIIEIRVDVLREKDGPMLEHGLQGFDGKALLTPATTGLRPRREFLEERYALFRRTG